MGLSAEQVGKSMEKLLNIIQTRPSQFRDITPDIILLSPPIINEDTEYCQAGNKYLGAAEKSKRLTEVYQRLAKRRDIAFIALDDIAPGEDGIHIDAEQHAAVANLVYKTLVS